MKTHSDCCYIVLPPGRSAPQVVFKSQEPVGFVWAGTTQRDWSDVIASGTSYCVRDLKDSAVKLLLNVRFWAKSAPYTHLLAYYVIVVLVYHAASPMAPDALVHLTLWAFKPHWTDTFHTSIARNRARFGIHAVMVANIWKQHEA